MRNHQEGNPSATEGTSGAVESLVDQAAPMQKRFCCHCGANLLNPDAKFCSSCGKPQSTTEVDEAKEHSALDIDEEGIAFLAIPRNHAYLSHILETIELDKTIRTAERIAKENPNIEAKVSTEKAARRTALLRLKLNIDNWWGKPEDQKEASYVSVTGITGGDYYFVHELEKSFESIFVSYRKRNDAMITDDIIKEGERGSTLANFFGGMSCLCCIFFCLAIWASAGSWSQSILYAMWIICGVFFCGMLVFVCSIFDNGSNMAEHKKEFQKGLLAEFDTKIKEINGIECVSENIWLLFFNEKEWYSYIEGNKVTGKLKADTSREECIVRRIYVFLLECEGQQCLNKIPKGTIYKRE